MDRIFKHQNITKIWLIQDKKKENKITSSNTIKGKDTVKKIKTYSIRP